MGALKQNMNPNYNKKEKIIYYYFKLCFLLEVDIRYNFCNLISSFSNKIHYEKSSNNLAAITSINNQVCCFEFDEIMKRLIEEENGVVLNSDALLYGVVDCFGWVDNIYNDLQKEFDFYKSMSKFSEEQLKLCFDIVDNINVDLKLKDRIKSYFLEINNYPFTGVSFFGNVVNSRIISNEDKEKVILMGVCSYFEDFAFNIVCSVQQDDDSFIYFVFGEDDKIRVFDNSEMIELIETNKIIVNKNEDIDYDKDEVIKSSYYFLPGIDWGLQCQMNKVASLELIPLACEKSYLNSLGENGNSYVKKI